MPSTTTVSTPPRFGQAGESTCQTLRLGHEVRGQVGVRVGDRRGFEEVGRDASLHLAHEDLVLQQCVVEVGDCGHLIVPSVGRLDLRVGGLFGEDPQFSLGTFDPLDQVDVEVDLRTSEHVFGLGVVWTVRFEERRQRARRRRVDEGIDDHLVEPSLQLGQFEHLLLVALLGPLRLHDAVGEVALRLVELLLLQIEVVVEVLDRRDELFLADGQRIQFSRQLGLALLVGLELLDRLLRISGNPFLPRPGRGRRQQHRGHEHGDERDRRPLRSASSPLYGHRSPASARCVPRLNRGV